MDTRLRASPRHGGAVIFWVFNQRSAAGASHRGRRQLSYPMGRRVTVSGIITEYNDFHVRTTIIRIVDFWFTWLHPWFPYNNLQVSPFYLTRSPIGVDGIKIIKLGNALVRCTIFIIYILISSIVFTSVRSITLTQNCFITLFALCLSGTISTIRKRGLFWDARHRS